MSALSPVGQMELAGHGLRRDYLLADDAKLEKTPFSQLADFQPLPSRDSLGVYHVISRLLGQFKTFRGENGRGESRDSSAEDDVNRRKSRDTCTKQARPASWCWRALLESRRVVQPG